jgi:hypothetical protein
MHPKAEDILDLYPDPAAHPLLDPLAEALVAIADTGVRVAAPVVAEPPARSGVRRYLRFKSPSRADVC